MRVFFDDRMGSRGPPWSQLRSRGMKFSRFEQFPPGEGGLYPWLCADLVGFGPPEQPHFSRIFMFAAKIADA